MGKIKIKKEEKDVNNDEVVDFIDKPNLVHILYKSLIKIM